MLYEVITIRPGMSAEIVLTVGFEDDTTPLKPGRTLKKQFSEAPAVSVSDPGFKIVSVKQNISDEVINGTIIIRAGDELISGRSAEISAVWGGLSAATTLYVKKNPAVITSYSIHYTKLYEHHTGFRYLP